MLLPRLALFRLALSLLFLPADSLSLAGEERSDPRLSGYRVAPGYKLEIAAEEPMFADRSEEKREGCISCV